VPPATAELVVLLDEAGNAIGTATKATVHTADTPLHRAFSGYLFGPDDRLLLTRRAHTKLTFPGVCTNSVCGHPGPGEADIAALCRRAGTELGLAAEQVTSALPHFRYRAESGGVVENEICPVYLARTTGEPHPDPTEVEDYVWCTWAEFLARLAVEPNRFSPWCRTQAAQLQAGGAVAAYLQAGCGTPGLTRPDPA
jgi:isopentenyl-diphosphate delta-isomerase